MRWFFLALFLSNIGFFAWHLWQGGPVVHAQRMQGSGLPEHGLALLSELTTQQRPPLREAQDQKEELPPLPSEASATKDTHPETASPVSVVNQAEHDTPPPAELERCFHSAEFDSRDELEPLAHILDAAGVSDYRREMFDGVRVNYWVMLAPYASLAKADEASKILQGRKVKDFFIVRSGQYVNAVSLGVYSTRERAQRRVDEIVALKLRLREPRIELRSSEAERHIITFRSSAKDVEKLLADVAEKLPANSFTENSCK